MTHRPAVRLGTAAVFLVVMLTSMLAISKALRTEWAATTDQHAESIPTQNLIQPAELVKIVQGNTSEKPLMIQVGSRVLYEEAHIPGSEYIGAASSPEGREKLRQRLQSVSRKKVVVLYCGCCPWSHCPNVKPAWDLVHSLGFSRAKVLYISTNFGADWVEKGYPTAKGQ
jgi:hypothetical protein